MNDDATLPALRPLDIVPFRDERGELFFQLQDSLRISPRPLVLSGAGYYILTHLDGAHTLTDVLDTYRRELQQDVPAGEVERVIEVLEHYVMLDTPRFTAAYQTHRQEYRDAPFRDSRERWPAADALRQELDELLSNERKTRKPMPGVRGLVSPHLDYTRGAPCYAAAYSALGDGAGTTRFVILGTNHYGRCPAPVATTKDFQTPLGLVRTDREFIGRLEHRLGSPICDDEFDHRAEHSIDLQVHVLQVTHADEPFEIVPILCPDVCTPGSEADPIAALDALAAALARELADDNGQTVLIAGADLSHVGQRFGDESPATPDVLEKVRDLDRHVLELLQQNRPQELLAEMRTIQNPTSICSLGCLYLLRRALPGRPWRTLRYHQAVDQETDTNVTCAAAVIA
ncbi:MAG: AmmeMemoRadiSam system protein B [Phycisphaerae bacterium]|jgi:AmmeMemoRadiSam system protein B